MDNERERKRARFEENAGATNKSRGPLVIAGVVAALVIAGAFYLMKSPDTTTRLERDTHATTAAAPGTAKPVAPSGASAASATSLVAEGDVYRIPVAAITTAASFYKATEGSTTVPFFAVRDATGQLHVALDACHVCAESKKGYVQQGDEMKCRNCGKLFAIAQITEMGDEGGCHPVALPTTTSGDAIVVKKSDVAAGAKLF